MKNILVIEEDRNFSHLLCQFLRKHNFQAITAINPATSFQESYSEGSFLIRDYYPALVICSLESFIYSLESLVLHPNKCQIPQKILSTFNTLEIPWILLTSETIIFDLSGNPILSEVTIMRKPVALHNILKIVQNRTSYSSIRKDVEIKIGECLRRK
jgi:hypothetical protein